MKCESASPGSCIHAMASARDLCETAVLGEPLLTCRRTVASVRVLCETAVKCETWRQVLGRWHWLEVLR